jgi:thioredoxin 1
MGNRNAVNVVVIVAVVGIVVAAGWYKSQRGQSGNPDTPISPTVAEDTPTPKVADGELCPEGVPATEPAVSAVVDTQPAVAASQPTAKLPRVVDLGADKCKACKALAPILEELKKEYAGRVAVEFIDVWKNPAAGKEYGIRVIPTQVFFDRDGKEVWRHEGFLPKAEFVAKFAELGVE